MEDFRRNRVGTAPSQNSAITMQVYLSFSGSFSGRWIGPGIVKERLPFWGKVWYNRTAERKNAAGRPGLRLRLAGAPLRVLFDYCSANTDCNSFHAVIELKTGISKLDMMRFDPQLDTQLRGETLEFISQILVIVKQG